MQAGPRGAQAGGERGPVTRARPLLWPRADAEGLWFRLVSLNAGRPGTDRRSRVAPPAWPPTDPRLCECSSRQTHLRDPRDRRHNMPG